MSPCADTCALLVTHPHQDDMTKEEAMALVARGIRSGVMNDLGSGSNIDLAIITKEGTEYLRNYEFLQDKTYARIHPVVYPKGTAREWRAAPRSKHGPGLEGPGVRCQICIFSELLHGIAL